MGNPTKPTPVSLSVQVSAVDAGSVSRLNLCPEVITLVPADPTQAAVATQIQPTVLTTVSGASTTVATITVPAQSYDHAELSLGAVCSSLESVALTNANGSFSITASVTATFQTPFVVTGSTKTIELGIQPMIAQLASVNTNSQLQTVMGSTPGTVNVIDAFTWTGAGFDMNWTTAANWYGGSVPGADNTAVFTGLCGSRCSAVINTKISVKGIWMMSDYPGTLTQGLGNQIVLYGDGISQSAGTFSGGDSLIAINGGSIRLSGGIFRSTSDILQIYSGSATGTLSAFSQSGGSFIHNSGTVLFSASADVTELISASSPLVFSSLALYLYNPTVGFSPTVTYSLGGGQTWRVLDEFVVGLSNNTSGQGTVILQGGSIQLEGIVLVYAGASNASTTSFTFAGSNLQTYTETAGAALTSGPVVVAKTGSSLQLTSSMNLGSIGQSLTINSGSVVEMQGFSLDVGGALVNNGTLDKSGGTLTFGSYSGSGTVNP